MKDKYVLRQVGGKYLMFYSSGDQEWLNTEFHAGNTTSGECQEKNFVSNVIYKLLQLYSKKYKHKSDKIIS